VLRDYEILFIVRPDLDDERFAEAVKTVETLIANLGGKSKKSDVWGRRKLAFEVRNLREGQYVLTDFEIDPQRVPELEAALKISDTVFRHLVVRKPDRRSTAVPVKPAAAAAPAAAEKAEPVVEVVEAVDEVAEEPDSEAATG
jgi:small subunit ribosomal protein S6